MREALRADFNRYYDLLPKTYTRWQRFIFFLSCPGLWAILDFRFRQWLLPQPRWIRLIFLWPVFLGHTWLSVFTGISIKTAATIGKGFYIGHYGGIFIHPEAVLGEGCSVSQGVTIGVGGRGENCGVPTVGNNVYFAAGCKVFGKITIGNNVQIGANAVLFKSVPDGATAVGVPARIIERG